MPLEYASQTEFPATTEKPLAEKHRCRYTNNRGQRCPHRLVDSVTNLCTIHQRQLKEETEQQAQANYQDLFDQTGKLETREEIRQFLTQLLRLAVLEIVPKDKAALLTYNCSLILQTFPLRRRPGQWDDDDDDEEGVGGNVLASMQKLLAQTQKAAEKELAAQQIHAAPNDPSPNA